MKIRIVAVFILMAIVAGCANKIPKDALQLSPTALADRQMQTRRFETANYDKMLTAASHVFQDLGFNLDETDRTLGLLVGSKKSSAVSGGQVFGSILLALFTGVAQPIDKEQTIRASLVMREIQNTITPTAKPVVTTTKRGKTKRGSAVAHREPQPTQSTVRITFQRVVINDRGMITRTEQINDAKIYQEFFDKLSQAVFLEAHEL